MSSSPVAPGDQLIVESFVDAKINRRVTVLADGTIALPYIGSVSVAGQNVAAIEKSLTTKFQKFFRSPGIQVYRGDLSVPLDVATTAGN